MAVESTNEEIRELTLLEQIESDPDVNQSTLALNGFLSSRDR